VARSKGISRRRFLAGTAGAAAAAALPASMRRVLADPAPTYRRAGLEQIEHVIIWMQENRSFDSYFGTLRGVRGFQDPDAQSLPNGDPVFRQPLLQGVSNVAPFHIDIDTSMAACVSGGSQSWDTSHNARNGGVMDGWVDANVPLLSVPHVMGHYDRTDLPFYYALADAFTICDHSFCSVLGPTNPNRLHLWTGTVDAAGQHGGPVKDNDRPHPFRWTTYPERLDAAGISWRVYQQEDNFDDNPLEWFANFQAAPKDSSLYVNGMTRRPEEAFAEDVRNDNLPQVSWLVAPANESEHPSWRPCDGAALTQRYLDALWSNPKVWAKSLVIFTYDEHGGAFDHVAPPSPPEGTPGEFIGTQPIGLGFRVPTILISPWTQGGWLHSDVLDHTSVLQFLEAWTGIEEPNISQWRRSTTGDFVSALDLCRPDVSFPMLPSTAEEVARSACAPPKAAPSFLPIPIDVFQPIPAQEPGDRPRRDSSAPGCGVGGLVGGVLEGRAQVPESTSTVAATELPAPEAGPVTGSGGGSGGALPTTGGAAPLGAAAAVVAAGLAARHALQSDPTKS
jgi:phospholipase C